jgi:hypothetical protein
VVPADKEIRWPKSAKIESSHLAGLVAVGEGAFQVLAATSEQPLAPLALHAAAVAIYRIAGLGVAVPVLPPAVRLADVAAGRFMEDLRP